VEVGTLFFMVARLSGESKSQIPIIILYYIKRADLPGEGSQIVGGLERMELNIENYECIWFFTSLKISVKYPI
jgi:hypothetical protein